LVFVSFYSSFVSIGKVLKLSSIYGILFAEYHVIFTTKVSALFDKQRADAIGLKEHPRRMETVNFSGQ